MKELFKSYGLAFLWALIVLRLSTMSLAPLQELGWTNFVGWDKLGHIVMYFVQTTFLFYGIIRYTRMESWSWIVVMSGLLPPIIYGFLIELLQANFFEGRYFEFLDFVANTIGCLAAFWMIYRLKKMNVWIFSGQQKKLQ